MRKIFHWLWHRPIIASIGIAALFWFLHRILNLLSLEYRQWVTYTAILIALILMIRGIFQLIFKIRKKPIKVAIIIILAVLFLVTSPYILFFAVFTYKPEHVVMKNDIKLVGYVTGFLDTSVDYYDYKNFFVRSARRRLYENYGSGGFDPIKNTARFDYEVKNETWYNDEGNPIE